MFMLHHLIVRTGDRLSAEVGLTSSRWLLLCAIGEAEAEAAAGGESPTVGELSERASLSVQGVSRMLGAMEGEGLVSRSTRPGRGRAVFVSLTESGRAALEATEALAERFEAGFLRGIDGGEVASLEAWFARLISNVAALEEELIECDE